MVNYSVNGKYFISYSAFVKQSHGLLGLPEQKERYSYNWAEKDGIEYDLNEPVRFNERRISLEMFFVGDTWDELSENFTLLMDEFKKSGRQRLIVEPFGYNPLVYDVILGSEVYLEKRFKEGRMFGVCTLNVIEPNPIKRVFMLVGGTLNLKYNSDGQTRVKIDGDEYVYFGNVDEGYSISERDILIKPSVGGLEIGGRNYLSNSGFNGDIGSHSPVGWLGAPHNTTPDIYEIVESPWSNDVNAYHIKVTEARAYLTPPASEVPAAEGDVFTVSVQATGSLQAWIEFQDENGNYIIRYTNVSLVRQSGNTYAYTTPPAPSGTKHISLNRLGLGVSGVYTGEAIFEKPRLEKGNKATDWTPAPEDVHYVTIEGYINLLQTNADEVI